MPSKKSRLRVMVSSTIHGAEDFLTQIYATLSGYRYEVWMSHVGTIFVDPNKSNFENCIAAVENCDAFLGIITGHYGSGREASGLSITHLEMRRAIELKKPRWFLVDRDVTIARQLLKQFRVDDDGRKKAFAFKPTPILDDIQIIDLYEEAIQIDVPLADRRGNWVQPYSSEVDALRFIKQQFSRPAVVHKIVEGMK